MGVVTRRALSFLLVLTFAGVVARAFAQTSPSSFQTLLKQYQHADADAAVESFARWPQDRVEGIRRDESWASDVWMKAAAALLHTETGFRKNVFGATRPEVRVINHSLGEREVHFRSAFELVESLTREASASADADLLEFCRRWYVLAFQAGGRLVHGVVEARFAEDPEVATLLGAWDEQMMGPEVNDGPAQRLPGLYGNAMLTTSHGRFAADSAAKSERLFRRALATDPGWYPARLHLGRLLFTLDRAAEAQAELERTLREAGASNDAFTTYLAALFLGQLHELEARYDTALDMYRRAASAYAHGQAAVLAAGRLQVSLGQHEQGWRDIRAMLEANRDETGLSRDPWQYYRYHRMAIWDRNKRTALLRALVRR